MKGRVNNIELQNRKFPSSEYKTTVDIMQVVAVFVILVRESTIILKDVLQLLATFWLWGNPNRNGLRFLGGNLQNAAPTEKRNPWEWSEGS
jgi:hypothetical protein